MSDLPEKPPLFFYVHGQEAHFIILTDKVMRMMKKGYYIKTPFTNITLCYTPDMEFTLSEMNALVHHTEGEAVDPELVKFICEEAHVRARKKKEEAKK
jgi:hypothetical protein